MSTGDDFVRTAGGRATALAQIVKLSSNINVNGFTDFWATEHARVQLARMAVHPGDAQQ